MLLGSTAGQVVSWSDTQVVATVAPTALTGIARIQQNGVASNGVGFTVPATNGNTLVPNQLTLLVGDTHTLQALNAANQPVTGLTWTSSDPTVVSLSTDDPPILTAVAVGDVTITAGTASADVTVTAGDPSNPGSLPLGTLVWSNPADAYKIVPAVPSPTGVADVFAFLNDFATVQAITSDGTTAWTADITNGFFNTVPDFQGGLVVLSVGNAAAGDPGSIRRLDGMTGQVAATYTPPTSSYMTSKVAVHTDGTIFALQENFSASWTSLPSTIVGIDPTSGAQKFSVQLPTDMGCQGVVQGPQFAGDPIIAGDGYFYFPYQCQEGLAYGYWLVHVMLTRVNSEGASDNILVKDFIQFNVDDMEALSAHMITNADTGVVLTWLSGDNQEQGMAITNGTSVSVMGPIIPGQDVQPVLQAQDGSFVGVYQDPSSLQYSTVAFDQSGNVRWIVPNDQPLIATDDGGAGGQSGVMYDENGNATELAANLPTFSFTGTAYYAGPPISQVAMLSLGSLLPKPKSVATTLWNFLFANQAKNKAATKQPFSLGGPTFKTTQYNGTPLTDCFDRFLQPTFFGYSTCAAYTVLDNENPPKKIVRAGIEFEEEVVVKKSSSPVDGQEGPGYTDAKGIFTDMLAFGHQTTPLQNGEFEVDKQTIKLKSTGAVVRVNCLDFEVTGVTVTDITQAPNTDCVSLAGK